MKLWPGIFVFGFASTIASAGLFLKPHVGPREKREISNPSQLSDAMLVFRSYFDCQKHFDETLKDPLKNLRQCTDQFFNPAMSEFRKRDYEQWLFQNYEISEAYLC